MAKGKQKGHDYSTLLIFSAAVVTVVRYAAAFIASDMGEIEGWLSDWITVLMGVSGLGMGILDVFGGAYLFDGWRRSMPANGKSWSFRFKVLTGFVFGLIVTGVMILVPFTVSRVTHESMATVLDSRLALNGWALLVNMAPYLLIGGVAVGNQVVMVSFQSGAESYRKDSDDDRKVTGNFPVSGWNDWRKIPREHREKIAVMRTDEIVSFYGVEARTARNWRTKAQKERE